MHKFLIFWSTKFIEITHKNTVTVSQYTHYTCFTKTSQILLFRKKMLFWELYTTRNIHVIGKAPYFKYQSKSDRQLPLSFKGLINRQMMMMMMTTTTKTNCSEIGVDPVTEMFFCRLLFLDVSKSGYTVDSRSMMHQKSIGKDLKGSYLIRSGMCLESGENQTHFTQEPMIIAKTKTLSTSQMPSIHSWQQHRQIHSHS